MGKKKTKNLDVNRSKDGSGGATVFSEKMPPKPKRKLELIRPGGKIETIPEK